MTLLERILALPADLRAQQNTQNIANAINGDETFTMIVEYWLTDRGLVSDLVMQTGDSALSDSILTKFDNAILASRSAKALINRLYIDDKGLNFGDTALMAWFIANTPSLFTSEECAALLKLPVRQGHVDEFEVRKLCWSDDGQWLV